MVQHVHQLKIKNMKNLFIIFVTALLACNANQQTGSSVPVSDSISRPIINTTYTQLISTPYETIEGACSTGSLIIVIESSSEIIADGSTVYKKSVPFNGGNKWFKCITGLIQINELGKVVSFKYCQ